MSLDTNALGGGFSLRLPKQINLKYPKLKEDAIPCIFPGLKYLSNPQTKRKSPRKQDSSLISSKKIKVVEAESKISEHPCSNDFDPEFSKESSVLSNEQKFEKICCDLESITLPDNWKYEIHRGTKPYIVSYTIKCNNNEAGIIIEKQIFLDSDMILKCSIYEKNINLQYLCGNSNICSLDDLISIMIILSSKKICAGGPKVQEFESISVECADIVFKNHWQHKRCPYLIDKSSIQNKCSFCKGLRRTFRLKKSRLSVGKSTRLLLSPTKKKQVDEYRNKKHIIQKQLLRAKHRIKYLQDQLNEVKERLNQLSNSSVNDLII
ncbi:hypothetical protein ACI65C_012238 [Semiaphis heraclei]